MEYREFIEALFFGDILHIERTELLKRFTHNYDINYCKLMQCDIVEYYRKNREQIIKAYKNKLGWATPYPSYQNILDTLDTLNTNLNVVLTNLYFNIAAQQDIASLPNELDTDRARKYFARAIEIGYMAATATGYKWEFGGKRGSLARLGYFVERIYCPTNTEQIPEQSINKLFGVNRIASAITQLHTAKKPQKWRAEIDNKIFFD